jgi:DNA (cytosine-5)-methyltransferase 1
VNQKPDLTHYEFFAGGGMARLGLGERWRCLFANDFDPVKARTYRANFADAEHHFHESDVWSLTANDIPGRADLAWASSPCQDFSLAGSRAGLKGGRSSAFFGFWRLMQALDAEGRAPRLIVIENVVGLLTSHGGTDFTALCRALNDAGYRFGALEIDAAHFTPQSRPRVFVIAAKAELKPLEGPGPFHTRAIAAAHARLPDDLKAAWLWWRLDAPARRNIALDDLLEPDEACAWRTEAQTQRLLAQMDGLNAARIETLKALGGRHAGAAFRRMRGGVQRAEARFDGLAGCLRTPRGGSSRQLILVVEAGKLRSRWLTAREGARLMGLPEDYRLPASQSPALHVIGDGLAVPVVRHLAAELLEPLLAAPVQTMAAE